MSETDLKKIMLSFSIEELCQSIVPFGSGHINNTFKVETEHSNIKYILQDINKSVFTNVPDLMNNIDRVCSHIRSKLELNLKQKNKEVLTIIPTKKAQLYHIDEDGNYWRVFRFIENHIVLDKIETNKQAFEIGKMLGEFQHHLSDFPTPPLYETIPNFHKLKFRLENLEKAIQSDTAKRVQSVKKEINQIEERSIEMLQLSEQIEQNKIPSRITHNDTKCNNFLLNSEHKGLCVIDLDTVMPGTVLYDFGDAIRTSTNTGDEDDINLDNISLNINLFSAYVRGYMEEAQFFLIQAEIEQLAFSAKFMTYIMATRFFTDYLNGDIYYKINHPEHNLQRSQAQLKLLSSMEFQFKDMKKVIVDSLKK